ncbi:MAG: hypothetical protein KatS3mg019_2050 [Fimbriimonadales bacterium]|nr:MAG: hypothetical protein KatS3mg019_2050 [Fimbriimonadales bacterium]
MSIQVPIRTHETPSPPDTVRLVSRVRWDAFQRRLRLHLRVALGLLPNLPPAPLRPLRCESYRGEGFHIERFALETLPNFYLTGSLFVPETPAGRRAPAMLQPHGHFEHGRYNAPDLFRAVALAQAGVYVLQYDMLGYNDLFQLPHAGAEPLEWRRWGFSRAGLQTWNSLCALEWLRRQRVIDPRRIGCNGISGGGTQTFLLSAVEPRLSCAAPVKMVSSIMQGGCLCENAPLLRLFAGNPEIAALTAPRPMLLISDSGDWTRDNPTVVAPYLQRVYALHDAETQFTHAHYEEGHQWGAAPRRAFYEWLAQLWRLPRVPQNPHLDAQSLTPALRVWGDKLPRPDDAPTGEAVFRLYRAQAQAAVRRWRRTVRFESEARAALLGMLGLERIEDALGEPMPEPWTPALHADPTTRCAIVFGAVDARRWQRERYTVLRLPELQRIPTETNYAYFSTYNLTPDAACVRAILSLLLRLRPRATQLQVAAQGEWAILCALACAIAQIPLNATNIPETESLDLPCYDRIGGWKTLQALIPRIS